MTYPKLTGAPSKMVGGVTFRCYSVGILKTEWRSEDGRIVVGHATNFGHAWATVDGMPVRSDHKNIHTKPKRFRTTENAMREAVALLRRFNP